MATGGLVRPAASIRIESKPSPRRIFAGGELGRKSFVMSFQTLGWRSHPFD